jgi:starch synthase
VVVDGETGVLVPLELRPDSFEPADAEGFERNLANAVNSLMADPELRGRMGKAGRARAEQQFSWRAIAERTLSLYRELVPAGAVV